MAIDFDWGVLYSHDDQIDDGAARNCIHVMRLTAKVHDRDFSTFPVANFVNKVNSLAGSERYNWLKVRIGTHRDTGYQVAMIYHLLRHRISAGSRAVWSLSVGVDPFLLPKEWIGRYTPGSDDLNWRNRNNPFLQMAYALNDQITKDLTSIVGAGPPKPQAVIYDDIDLSEDPSAPAGEDPRKRRTTAIGELGWVAQYAIPADLPNRLSIISIRKIDVPKNALGQPIPGWGRPASGSVPADKKIVETIIQVP